MPVMSSYVHCLARASLAAALLVLLYTPAVDAACNLRPVAEIAYPSNMGALVDPLTTAGRSVKIQLNPACDGSAGFEPAPMSNDVTLRFEPPTGAGTTDVAIDAGTIAVGDCTLPGGRCRELSFIAPDTTLLLAPHGLAGPSRILVEDAGAALVAEIADLFQPTTGCDRQPETVFGKFTVLPAATNFSDLANGIVMEVLATVDGGNNLLVPLDYWGGGANSVLADTPGSPVAVFLEGELSAPAMGAGDVNTVADVLASQSSRSRFVRSFTFDGRPLPPLLRVTSNGGLFGTADAVESVLRVARNLDGTDIHDFTDRLASGKGPIVLTAVAAGVNDPVPLASLRSDESSVAYARNEAAEAVNLNPSSGDLDTDDRVGHLTSAGSGDTVNTEKAVVELIGRVAGGLLGLAAPQFVQAVFTRDGLTAILESEAAQNQTDLNADGDTFDGILRVYDETATELTGANTLDVAKGGRVDNKAVAVAEGFVVTRTPGALTGLASANNRYHGWDVAYAADGLHAYADIEHLNFVQRGVTTLALDGTTGAPSFLDFDSYCGGQGSAGVFGFLTRSTMAIAPDGETVYGAGTCYTGLFPTLNVDSYLATFDRDPVTGLLTNIQTQHQTGANGVDGAAKVLASPDDAHVYLLGSVMTAPSVFEPTITGYARQPDGTLTGIVAQEILSSLTIGAFGNFGDMILTPDGEHLYVNSGTTTPVASEILRFDRNPATGALTFLGTSTHTSLGAESVVGPMVASPDSRHVYIAPGEPATTERVPLLPGSEILVLERDLASGDLGLVDGIRGIGVLGLTASADGTRIYAVGDDLGSPKNTAAALPPFPSVVTAGVYELARDGVSGSLALLGLSPADAAAGLPTGAIDVSPDGDHVMYAVVGLGLAFSGYVSVGTRSQLAIFDSTTTSILATQPPAELADVAGGVALLLTPEGEAGIDLNGDGDMNDDGAQLYDPSDTLTPVTNLGVAAAGLAITEDLLAVLVPEGDEDDSDRNGDGDVRDAVLAVAPFSDPSAFVNIGISAETVDASGPLVVLAVSERSEGNGDLNGDGDTADRVLHVYDHISGKVTSLGIAVDDFAVEGTIVAFRVPEEDENMTPLNGDGDTAESVMHVFDLATAKLFNTQRAASPCTMPGCEPGTHYKIKGKTVSFLTDELEQGSDLNGDLDSDDVVVTIFTALSGAVDSASTAAPDVSDAGTVLPESDPLPQDSFDGTVQFVEVRESDISEDVNEDGMVDDAIVFVLNGDQDDDGILDDFDSCVEAVNTGQTDGDGDGLGDTACDPDPSACPTTPLAGCRLPASQKSRIKIKANAEPKKQQLKWKWGKGDAAPFDDLGHPVAGEPVYSVCLYDGSVSSQPLIAEAVQPGRICGRKPCWKEKPGKGFSFKDKDGTAGGVQHIKLKAGDVGKAKVQLKAKGANLSLPMLPLTTGVTVQLVVSEGATQSCFEATYSTPQRNDSGQFSAKSD